MDVLQGVPVEVTTKLYECRREAKRLFSCKYSERVEAYQGFIRDTMKNHEVGILDAMAAMVAALQEQEEAEGKSTGISQMLAISAAVEMLEEAKVL